MRRERPVLTKTHVEYANIRVGTNDRLQSRKHCFVIDMIPVRRDIYIQERTVSYRTPHACGIVRVTEHYPRSHEDTMLRVQARGNIGTYISASSEWSQLTLARRYPYVDNCDDGHQRDVRYWPGGAGCRCLYTHLTRPNGCNCCKQRRVKLLD